MITRLKVLATFWYDFIVGDDWRIALGSLIAVGATALVSLTAFPAWWIVPGAILALVPLSLQRAVRLAAQSDEPDAGAQRSAQP